MLAHRVWALWVIGGTMISACMQTASAQSCDHRYPMTCPGFMGSPSRAPQPRAPLPPQVLAPRILPQPEPMGPAAGPVDPAVLNRYAGLYARLDADAFPVPAVNLT